jgi:SOS-response transcriptional repressor LexA
MEEPRTIRPTKKQRELLSFISAFIAEHGYSPSYREIMAGLNYTSVATVALHVNSLVKRGHIRKRDFSARSLEVVAPHEAPAILTNQVLPNEEKWLVGKTEHAFRQAEQGSEAGIVSQLDDLYVLIEALRVLGLEAAAQSFRPRLQALKRRVGPPA